MKKKHSNKSKKAPVAKVELNKPSSSVKSISFSNKTNNRIQIWFLFALAIGLYANTLFFEYNLDDGLLITENNFTKKGFGGISDIFTNDALVGCFGQQKNLYVGGRYRPLSQVFFAIEYEFFGLSPFTGHLFNILFYALLGLLIFIVLKKLFKEYYSKLWYLSVSFLAAALFIAHPLHTEVVANIKSLDEIMCMLGAMGALYFTLKYKETNKTIHLILSGIVFLGALLSKENAITFLAIIPLTLFVFTDSRKKDYIITIIPLIIATVAFMLIRYNALGIVTGADNIQTKDLNVNPFIYATFGEKYATIFYTWGKYLKLLFIPHPLTHDYYPQHIPIINWADMRAIIPVIIYLALIVYALITVWKKNMTAYGILFFMLSFSVTSNLVFNLGLFMNERFMFTPLLGFTIIIAFLLAVKWKDLMKDSKTYHYLVVSVLLILFFGYSIKTISRNLAWKDGYTLFTTDVKTSSNSSRCNIVTGNVLFWKAKEDENKLKKDSILNEAMTYLKRGIELDTSNIGGWIYLGSTYVELQDYKQGRRCFERVIRKEPNNSDALNYLLHIAQKNNDRKEYAESIHTYNILVKYHPRNAGYLEQLADVYLNMNKPDTSIAILNTILTFKPDYYKAYTKLGEIYGRVYNNIDKAYDYSIKAYKINPKDAMLLENLGIICGMKRNFEESLKYFQEAATINPNDEKLYNNIAQTYKSMGNAVKAQEYFAKANQILAEKSKK